MFDPAQKGRTMRDGRYIDLRSDTVTKPTPAMREAMMRAEVGDDVYAEDPTVNRLQDHVAALLGKEAALFVPSGVMANQIAIKCHTQPGEEIIVEAGGHVFNYETAAAAFISNTQVMPIAGTRGVMRLEQIIPAIRSDIYYNPRTALICLENTHNRAGGTIYPLDEIERISLYARSRNIRMHLDGARLWNASVATGIALKVYASQFDTVSVCFSKGLGAPVGSALVGSRETITRARKFRKILGGGMRQAGILAAAALHAVEHHQERLAIDHANARKFAEAMNGIRGVSVDPSAVQTNIVVLEIGETGRTVEECIRRSRDAGVLISEMGYTTLRAVTHMDVSEEEVMHAAEIVAGILRG
jgi:threonine aldolase